MQQLTDVLSSMPMPASSPDRLPVRAGQDGVLSRLSDPSLMPAPQEVIASVFGRLSAQLGGKMAVLYAGVDPLTLQAEWAERLADLHDHELRRGLRACADRKFAPTLGEFRQFCRPCLDPEIAWLEAATGLADREQGRVGEWTHPAVYRAACVMSHEVRTGRFADYRRRWEWTMQRELQAGWGEAVPAPAMRIQDQRRVGPPPAHIRHQVAGILAAARQSGRASA
ncbi:hypothetical protein [uncultured Xylophilus sp.]|uniref:hypothetical protein n=1 Tax=uncultured Xylophilus sp. TaxID=296832 RepID=UPI0025EDE2E1|nr:hypothetical protein [uncultured Xylophilus sp.]